jgi:hypothetical protein
MVWLPSPTGWRDVSMALVCRRRLNPIRHRSQDNLPPNVGDDLGLILSDNVVVTQTRTGRIHGVNLLTLSRHYRLLSDASTGAMLIFPARALSDRCASRPKRRQEAAGPLTYAAVIP